MTTHGFVMRNVLHGSFAGKVVLIDEISFMFFFSTARRSRPSTGAPDLCP
jgi:hypothetical protein